MPVQKFASPERKREKERNWRENLSNSVKVPFSGR